MVGALAPGRSDETRVGIVSSERSFEMPQRGELVLVRPETRQRTRRPPLYRVLLHNDDYTPRAFVVAVLQRIFSKTPAEANRIMLQAHRMGAARVACYPREVAEVKVEDAMQVSRAAEVPLQFTMEPDVDPDGEGPSDP